MELLNYKDLGEGQPLVILHGFLGSLDNWLTLGKRFAENFKVILIDQRNHGKSFHSDKFDYDEMVNDLENLMNHLSLENPILLGHSMGGKTVMQLAAFRPYKVYRLIVADTGPKGYPAHHDAILTGLQAIPVQQLKSRQEADDMLSEYVPELSTRVFLLKNLKRTDGGFEWKMNLPALVKNVKEVGAELYHRLPVETKSLFIRGGNSRYILDGDFEEIEGIFPNAQFETIDNAGHWLHAEQPEEFYQKVINFVS